MGAKGFRQAHHNGRWGRDTTQHILRNRLHVGEVHYQRDMLKAIFEAVYIDPLKRRLVCVKPWSQFTPLFWMDGLREKGVNARFQLTPGPNDAGTVAELYPSGDLPAEPVSLLQDLARCDQVGDYVELADPVRGLLTPYVAEANR